MNLLKGRLKQLRVLLRKDDVERELDEELRYHIDMETEKNIRSGMSPDEARRAALLAFGGVERYKEEVREARWVRLFEDAGADFRFAARTLRRRPAFAVAVVLTLAIGIGGTTAVFSIVDGLFMRPPAGVDAPQDVVRLFVVRNEGAIQTPDGGPGSYVDFEVLRNGPRGLEAVAGLLYAQEMDLGRGADAERLRGRAVTSNYFPLLGVRPHIGRLFYEQEDDVEGAHPVAVVSHAFWNTRLARDPRVLGRAIELNGKPLQIVGVAEKGFTGIDSDPVDVWVPMAMAAPLGLVGFTGDSGWRQVAGMTVVRIVARLGAEADREAVVRDASAALRHAAESHPQLDPSPDAILAPLIPARGPHRAQSASLALWLGAVAGIVLAIAFANVVSLLVTRSTARRRELAVRVSLGAGRGRLTRQQLVEALLLTLIGGAAGILIAFLGTGVARQFPLPPGVGTVDLRVLVFALGVSLIAGLLLGLIASARSGWVDPMRGLRESRIQTPPSRRRLQRGLVAVQVALALTLLVGAGLFLGSLRKVYEIDPGVDVERLIAVSVDLSKVGYGSPEREAFYAEARRRLEALPGVERTAMIHFQPFGGSAMGIAYEIPGGHESTYAGEGPYVNLAGAGYFETAGTRILAGRAFREADGPGSEPIAVVNEAMARILAPAGEVVGLCVPLSGQIQSGGCTRIIGVVETERHRYLDDKPVPMVFLSRDRNPDAIPWGDKVLLVRTNHGAPAEPSVIRSAMQSLRSDLPYVAVQPVSERLRDEILPFRLGATLFTLFGVLGLTLAAVGLYGVLSYFVAERTPEIGVRKSLGASASAVVRLVVWQGFLPVGVGLIVGIALALAGAPLLSSLLFGVDSRDPLLFGGIAVFLVAIAMLSTVVPARRAARVDPMIALRAD